MKNILIPGFGSFSGTIIRYRMQHLVNKYVALAFPTGTFAVNVTGCFAIGFFYGLAEKYAWMTMEWRFFLIAGVCGAYTTFPTFSYEGIELFRQGEYWYSFLYAFLSVAIGMLATVGGLSIIK